MTTTTTLRPLSAWVRTDQLSSSETAQLARDLESWGYHTLWVPEILGRDAFTQAGWLLANTTTLRVATGIANIYLREVHATNAAALTLAEQSAGRFILGLGSSHDVMVERVLDRDHTPATDLERYVEQLTDTRPGMYDAPLADELPPIAIAALGPRLMRFAAARDLGVHTYLTTPDHTARTRALLGERAPIYPEMKTLLTDDPERGRHLARAHSAFYLSLKSYQRSLLRQGFEPADLDDGGSDRLIDSLVAIGDTSTITERITDFVNAGATQVVIQTIDPEHPGRPDPRAFEALADDWFVGTAASPPRSEPGSSPLP